MIDTTEQRVRIIADPDPHSPREDRDHLGTMYCWHGRYNLGDVQPDYPPDEWLNDAASGEEIILPLYLYGHSGLTMSLSPFSCRWDSGQVGWIKVELAEAVDCFGYPNNADWDTKDESGVSLHTRAMQCIKAEVEEYDDYLQGNVFGFIVEERDTCEYCGHGEWNEVDSCWGFIGRDMDTNGILEHLPEELHQMARDAEVEYR